MGRPRPDLPTAEPLKVRLDRKAARRFAEIPQAEERTCQYQLPTTASLFAGEQDVRRRSCRPVNEPQKPPPDDDYWNTVPLSEAFIAWRRERVSVEQVESEPIFGREQPLRPEFPEWIALKQQFQPGDELWTFDCPKRFWRQGMGWQGIMLVRSGRFVAACTTAMN